MNKLIVVLFFESKLSFYNSNFDAVVTNLGATVKEAYLEQQAEMGPQC